MSSPRTRRLAADYDAIRNLCRESSILDVSCSGDPPTTYLLKFSGRGLAYEVGKGIYEQWEHSVRVRLGTNYPRQIPELHWLTPIYHPNISANGLVCLGGYTTNWVPSLKLDDLCLMLWDMIRYRNFDPGSPYNRLAAEWARSQRDYILPLDSRPLRDRPRVDSGEQGATPNVMSTRDLDQQVDGVRHPGPLAPVQDGDVTAEAVGVELVEESSHGSSPGNRTDDGEDGGILFIN